MKKLEELSNSIKENSSADNSKKSLENKQKYEIIAGERGGWRSRIKWSSNSHSNADDLKKSLGIVKAKGWLESLEEAQSYQIINEFSDQQYQNLLVTEAI